MSRVSVLVVPLVAIAWAGSAPAQDKERVLQTVQKLESRLDQIDKYFRGLQTSEGGAMQAEIVSMRNALSATQGQFAEQVQTLTARAEGAERALETLTPQLDEANARTRAVEHELQTVRAQAAEAADSVAAAEARARTAEGEAARLTEELADAILEGQAGLRERDALIQRAEDAGASLAAEQDRVADLEYELDALRAELVQNPEASPEPAIFQIPSPEAGIQIQVHGGEATFHIHGSGLPLIQPSSTPPEPTGNPDLRLRLRKDGTSDRKPTVRPKVTPPRIHRP